MATPSPHERILAAAGRAHLQPLGVLRKGRSRLWLDDHGWWVALVEFQPSGWSKGSHLNVGVSLLWNRRDSLGFDIHVRAHDFVPYRDDASFSARAQELARLGAVAVEQYRQQFATLESASVALSNANPEPRNAWGHYHLAVVNGLRGRAKDARRSFASLEGTEGAPWVHTLKEEARCLGLLVDDPRAFHQAVRNVVTATRTALKLPESVAVSFS